MSPAFQLSLIDSPLTLNAEGESHSQSISAWTLTRTAEIRYYDTITLQHKGTKNFLHSHVDRYPVKYDDGRISSQGTSILNSSRVSTDERVHPQDSRSQDTPSTTRTTTGSSSRLTSSRSRDEDESSARTT